MVTMRNGNGTVKWVGLLTALFAAAIGVVYAQVRDLETWKDTHDIWARDERGRILAEITLLRHDMNRQADSLHWKLDSALRGQREILEAIDGGQ